MASVSLFVSYSSDDRDWLKRVVASLSPLEHDGLGRIWTDQNLSGLDHEGWEQNLLRNLNEAGYIVVLWSPSYSNSSYCRKELDLALERKRNGSAKVMLIHLRHCLLPRQVAEFQIRPSKDAAISASGNTDEALWRIAAEIQRELTLSSREQQRAPGTTPISPRKMIAEEPQEILSRPAKEPQREPTAPRRPIPRSWLYGSGVLLGTVILGTLVWLLPPRPVQKPPDKTPVADVPASVDTQKVEKTRPSYVSIAPGHFTMGCSSGDQECYDDEKPAHEVTITKGFRLGVTEVTQAAFRQVMKSNPSNFKGDDLPVESITWDEARQYCTAVGGRLPTEAEWEYAARAGSTGSRYGSLDGVAWYDGNSENKTHPVARKTPNAWGLYDMLGNVWEWTGDWYGAYQKGAISDPQGPQGGQQRVLRGGSWFGYDRYSRVSNRSWFAPSPRSYLIGVRCAWDNP